MSSIIEGYNYDIFISYRQKDNKYDGWVTEFVDHLKRELDATFKEEVSVYFDINPHDGLLETHDVGASLKEKLKCLIFIPIISQTYCDSKSFAWQHEFVAFNKLASEDYFGRDIKLASGNVSSRILSVKIHNLDAEDQALLENELGGFIRGIEFIYKEPGVNRPLKPEDDEKKNLNSSIYRNQINKVANSVKEILAALKKHNQLVEEDPKEAVKTYHEKTKNLKAIIILSCISILALVLLGYFFIPKRLNSYDKVEKSIAVLPFVNLSNDQEQEYFSDGMVDEILDRLFKVGDLKVIARTSSMRYKNTKLSLKEIAHELNVSALLEGSVQKIGNKVRITTQLIDAKTGFHLWSETFDRNLSDVFSIQTEVAQNVAQGLKSTLIHNGTDLHKNEVPTTNLIAYDYYLKANDYSTKYESFKAIDLYSKAIHEDPFFAVAYAKRAGEYLYLYWIKDEKLKDYDLRAQEDIKKGFSINPELPELKIAQASYYYYINRDYEKVLSIIADLKKITPNMPSLYSISSNILRRQGKWNESIIERERGLQFDPLDAKEINEQSHTYDLMHQFDNEIEWCKKGLSLIPDFDFNSNIFRAYINKTADFNLALKESGLKEENIQYTSYYYSRQYNKLIEFIYHDTTTQFEEQFYYHPKTYDIALIYFLSGNKSYSKIYADSAITILREKLEEKPNDERYYATLGKCYAFIGDNKEAISCGEKAIALKPVKLDAWQGIVKEQDLMEIYIFTKNYDIALEKIELLLSTPSELSLGELMIDPIFDSLRSLVHFQKIIDSTHRQH